MWPPDKLAFVDQIPSEMEAMFCQYLHLFFDEGLREVYTSELTNVVLTRPMPSFSAISI